MNNVYSKMKELLYHWKHDEDKILKDGTELILPLNKVIAGYSIPNQYFHELFAPLNINDLKTFVLPNVPVPLPESYTSFLQINNGLKIFDETIKIYGFRNFNIEYELDKAPFDLFTANEFRVKGTPDSWFIFGSYVFDGTKLVFDTANLNDKVYRIKKNSIEILNEWESFEVWLLSEAKRISELFDKDGNIICDDLEPKK